MNIKDVAVFSEADRGALFTMLGNQSICIGGVSAVGSYLNQHTIVTAAHHTGCDAVYPGFGLLSENAGFARLVAENNLCFIGPPAECIEKLRNKITARALMREHGVPVVPGSDGAVPNVAAARALAKRLGYPVLIKAALGCGGRNTRVVENEGQLEAAFAAAVAEAESSFGDDSLGLDSFGDSGGPSGIGLSEPSGANSLGNGDVYLEKQIRRPRHIEFQILADNQGNIIHLGERDCLLQHTHGLHTHGLHGHGQHGRRKMLIEAPALWLDAKTRQTMGLAAVEAARAVGYVNAGTVEFIVDENGAFYFVEMSARIQVGHPATEMITGIDIVREQIRIASGLPLRHSQKEIRFGGHAIECRIRAEDPPDGFVSRPGTVEYLHLPGGYGVRVDSVLHSGHEVSPYYDTTLAKVTVCGRNRDEAIVRMRRALGETVISGVTTNIDSFLRLMSDPAYLSNGAAPATSSKIDAHMPHMPRKEAAFAI
jgi:acetyl-CoA carboxylase biotin carboxylase subunit